MVSQAKIFYYNFIFHSARIANKEAYFAQERFARAPENFYVSIYMFRYNILTKLIFTWKISDEIVEINF